MKFKNAFSSSNVNNDVRENLSNVDLFFNLLAIMIRLTSYKFAANRIDLILNWTSFVAFFIRMFWDKDLRTRFDENEIIDDEIFDSDDETTLSATLFHCVNSFIWRDLVIFEMWFAKISAEESWDSISRKKSFTHSSCSRLWR